MRVKVVLAAVFVCMGGGAIWLLSGGAQPTRERRTSAQTVTVWPRTLTRTVRLSGRTSAREFVNITAPLLTGRESGVTLTLMKLVKSGTFVKKGDLIAQIDARETEDHNEDVADQVRQAEADIHKRSAEQAIEAAQLQQLVRQAKADAEKASLDAKTADLLTETERELLRLAVEETETRYRQLQKSVNAQKASHDAEMQILEITLERQKRHYERHLRDLTKYAIHAPMDGLAAAQTMWRGSDMEQIQQGDQIWPGQAFVQVINTATMQLEAKVNQVQSRDLRVGQKVTVRLDAFPDAQLPGTVSSIGVLAVSSWIQNDYIRNIPVYVSIDRSDTRLIPDLSGSADVELGRAENVLVAPLEAVHYEGGAETVALKAGGRFKKQAVSLGIQTNTEASVLRGLQAGDELRVP